MVTLPNLLDPDFGAVEAEDSGAGIRKGAEGCVADGHLGPVGLTPGEGWAKQQTNHQKTYF